MSCGSSPRPMDDSVAEEIADTLESVLEIDELSPESESDRSDIAFLCGDHASA